MTKTIKYVGTVDRWPELAVTGGQVLWRTSQQEQRPDSEAEALLLTGLFSLVRETAQYPMHVTPDAKRVATVLEGQALTITGAAGATGTMQRLDASGAPIGASITIGVGTLPPIGPFAGTQKILVTCTASSIDATVGDAVLVSQPRSAAGLRAANTIIPFGDSITANAWLSISAITLSRVGGIVTATDNSGVLQPMTGQAMLVEQYPDASFNGFVTISRISATQYSYPCPGPDATTSGGVIRFPSAKSDMGFFNWFMFLMNQGMRMIYNAGIGGNKTSDMLARIDADVISRGPAWVSEMSGINDVINGVPTATIIANKRQIWARLRAAGINVLALTTLPLESGHAAFSAANQQKILDINAAIRDECATQPGMIFCDAYSAIINSNSTTGQPNTGRLNSDHVHPGWLGAWEIGSDMYVRASPFIAKVVDLPRSAAGNRSVSAGSPNIWQYLPNTATGGSVSGTATGMPPGGFSVQSATGSPIVVASAPARTIAHDGDTCGYNCGMMFTALAAGDSAQIVNQNAAHVAYATVGKSYRWILDVHATGMAGANINKIDVFITFTIDGVAYKHWLNFTTSTTPPAVDMHGVMSSDEFILTGAVINNISTTMRVYASAAGSAVLFEEGCVGLIEKLSGDVLYF